ncbi:MAG: hypothetical protein VX181_19990, partial [Pseudomonadota bacterium]|nr:hypothetical protein [Pseudomonadota bacterium]
AVVAKKEQQAEALRVELEAAQGRAAEQGKAAEASKAKLAQHRDEQEAAREAQRIEESKRAESVRLQAEAAAARRHEDRATDEERTRRRVTELEERLGQSDKSLDLLRNAVARRDQLLAEQRAAFLPPPAAALTKVVLATDIAETSVTIPDVTLVIDGGLHRALATDERASHAPHLRTARIS